MEGKAPSPRFTYLAQEGRESDWIGQRKEEMNKQDNTPFTAALSYAQRGWPVIPLHSAQEGHCSCGRAACTSIGKHPRTAHGLKDATMDEVQIHRWWTEWANANVGIVTGAQSGLIVLDIDPRNGGEEGLADLERQHGVLPKTVLSLTGGGGQHFFFHHPGGSIKSKPIAEGVDVKADGGYVVVPPSSHMSGEPYRWESAGHPEDVPLAALPIWLCAKLTQRLKPGSQPSAALPSKTIREGQRNRTLASLAGAMRRHGADEATILHSLRSHNRQHCAPPLPEQEVNRIAGSIAKYPAGVRANPTSEQNGSGEGAKPGRVSCADQLMRVCEESGTMLFHDQFQEAYAWVSLRGHREVLKVHSKKFREWIGHQLWLKQEKAPTNEGLQSAINMLSARAKFTGPEHRLWNRVAWHDGPLWYDLGDAAVRIQSGGWEIITEPPLLFQRYTHQRPQVRPTPGGDLRRLLQFVNIPGDDTGLSPAQLLFLVSVVVMLVPTIPHPVLCVHAEQGSGKTTLFKVIRELIDPSVTLTLSPQDSAREFVQVASHHWAVFLDNLTTLPDWLSNAICRCVTGEGFSKRELFSDDEDILYSFLRCIGLNGINLVPSKPDLLDRAVILPLERIPDRQRRTEREFWDQFHAEKPQLLGALLTAMSHAMALIDRVRVKQYPRLADFAHWGAAVALALGASEQAFLAALVANTRAQTSEALEASPVAQALLKLMEGKSSWVGTPQELLKQLDQVAEEAGVDRKSRHWPKDTRWLWRRINEVLPNLLAVGLKAMNSTAAGKTQIAITRIAPENDPNDPGEDTNQTALPDRQGNIFEHDASVSTSVPTGNAAETITNAEKRDTGIIFPSCSGVDSTGWPIELPGMGPRELADYERCHTCQLGTWARYGGLPLCKRHALLALASIEGPKTLSGDCDRGTDSDRQENHTKGEHAS